MDQNETANDFSFSTRRSEFALFPMVIACTFIGVFVLCRVL